MSVYIDERGNPTDGRGAWKKFLCLACGYIYDERYGDPDGGLPAGTRFEDIPDDWQCPLCGVKKSDFEPYQDKDENVVVAIEFNSDQAGVVVIGAGLAGWSVVDAIRAQDKDIPITLISADDADRYHKPMLSAAISQNKTAKDLVRATGADSAKLANVRLLSNTFVVGIDATAKALHTTRGNVAYDDLVLAIGATPAYPPSISKEIAWHVNHLARFSQLQARLAHQHKNIAIVGAGMIGVELAEDLINAGHTVSLIDVSPRPLASLLPKMAGERVLQAIEAFGVRWLGFSMVNRAYRTDRGYAIELLDCADNSVQTLDFDEIIVATGLVIDERLPVRAGVEFHKRTGIVVDASTLQTSVPHIYAIGDCISIDGVPCRYVAPHRAQAAAIAGQILGGGAPYTHKPPMIRLKNKCISVQATGLPSADSDWQVVSDEAGKLVLQSDKATITIQQKTS